jgi:hypothetical protein
MRFLIEQGHALHSLGWRLMDDVQDAVTAMVVLFVFGTVLMALWTERMDKVELEVAARPARSFALGLVSLVVFGVLGVALCVTVIGIPLVLAAAVVGVFATYAGIVAAVRTAGAALIRHRTDNPYLHLALGCAGFFVAGAIPWIGDLVTLTVGLIGFGAVVGSRGAGYWPARKNGGSGYATA